MGSADGIRVVLADQRALVRQALRCLLETLPGVEVVGEAGTGAEALALACSLRPVVLVAAPALAGSGAPEVASRAARECPGVRVLILANDPGPAAVLRALRAGAAGYLVTDADRRELELALRAVAGGGTYLSPSVARHAVRDRLSTRPLTPRQRDVLRLIAEGRTTREIARLLGIGVKTVETHRLGLMKRLGTRSVAGLVRYALGAAQQGG